MKGKVSRKVVLKEGCCFLRVVFYQGFYGTVKSLTNDILSGDHLPFVSNQLIGNHSFVITCRSALCSLPWHRLAGQDHSLEILDRAETTSSEEMLVQGPALLGRARRQDEEGPPATPTAFWRPGGPVNGTKDAHAGDSRTPWKRI